jgi:hypothetical protein
MGRSALIMVLGFTTALLMIGSNITKVSDAAMENYMYYNNSAMAHSLAGAGMNLASRAIFENPLWRAGFSNKSFGGGTFSVQVEDLGNNQVKMTSTGTFAGVTSVVACVLQPSSFSKFNYYSVTDQNGYWVGGDTIWGPFHCNNTLNVAQTNGGSAVFMQKATSLNGINNYQGQAHPVFKGGYDSGVNVTLPSDLTPLRTSAQTGGKYVNGGKLWVQLNADGTVTWKVGGSSWGGGGWTTESISSFARNGAVWCHGQDVHVKGTLHGQLTIGSGAQIWIDDDVTYAADPRYGPSSDMLGLVAEGKLYISDVPANHNNDFTLMASVFSRTDGLWAENYSTRPVEGKMTTVGGMIQNIGGYTGVFSGNSIIHGFLPGGTYYDDRLMNAAPPFFPTTGNFEVVSWFE